MSAARDMCIRRDFVRYSSVVLLLSDIAMVEPVKRNVEEGLSRNVTHKTNNQLANPLS